MNESAWASGCFDGDWAPRIRLFFSGGGEPWLKPLLN